ncbi:hypothetical protein GCM10029978_011220 [Actinoallomurus acanthiterrae]
MVHKVAAGVAGALFCATAFVAAPAGAATGQPWTAQYRTATAGGEWSVTASPVITKVTVTGNLSNTGSGCYLVRLTVYQDLVSKYYYSAQQCGPGTVPVNIESFSGFPFWGASVATCAANKQDCGQEFALLPD